MKIELSGSRKDKNLLLLAVVFGIFVSALTISIPYQIVREERAQQEAGQQQATLNEILREVRELQ